MTERSLALVAVCARLRRGAHSHPTYRWLSPGPSRRESLMCWEGDRTLECGRKIPRAAASDLPRLPPLTEEQAFALCAADELLKEGMTPRALMKGLGLDPAALDALEKYNPAQPRVPAGSGRASGRWDRAARLQR